MAAPDEMLEKEGWGMKPFGSYKTMDEIRAAFADACKRNGWDSSEKNFQAYLHGLRVMRFTNL